MREMKESGLPWANNVPSDWDVIRGKNTVKKLKRPVKETDGVITCFRDGEVTLRSKRREEGFTFSDLEIGYQGIEPGDLVIHGMDGFAGAIGISDSRGKGTPVLNVLESKNDKRFLMYYFRAIAKCGYFESVATGIRVRTCDTNWNKIAVTPCLVPPLVEQSRIATFLDERCGKIDEAIAKHKALIEKLDEYRKAVITKAVTKGVRGKSTFKNIPIKYLVSYNQSSLTESTSKDFAFDYVDIGSVSFENGIESKERMVFEGAPSRARRIVNKDDVIVSTVRTYLKAVAQIPSFEVPIIVSTGFVVLTAKSNRILPSFLGYAVKSEVFIESVQMNSYGISYPAIKSSEVVNLKVAVPSLQEQSEIVAYLDKKCAAIDSAKERHIQLITKLEEYKKSLIYNAVTGKIEC